MIDFNLSILNWYRLNYRKLPWRETKDPYLIWLSEVIMQQTRIEQGLGYYEKFSSKYPDIAALASASEQEILSDWQGLGYYSRARNMHGTARLIQQNHQGRFPKSYDVLIRLKGIGPYTAAAISSIAFSEKVAVVDGNVFRVLSRVYKIDTPINSGKGKKQFQELAQSLIHPESPGDYNQGIMELGALICTPKNPSCLSCPVNNLCLVANSAENLNFPVKKPGTKSRDRFFHYLHYESADKLVLTRRTEEDIWKHLFQFPMIESGGTETPETLPEGFSSIIAMKRHVLSHQNIHSFFYFYPFLPEHEESNWITINKKELSVYPIPRLIEKYLTKKHDCNS